MIARITTPLFLVACLAGPALSQSPPSRNAMLLHGNYCGPGNNAPAAPIDALDAACARHDACTPTAGLASRACNLRLQVEAERIARDPRQSESLKAMAGLVSTGAGLMPSDPERTDPTLAMPTGLDSHPARHSRGRTTQRASAWQAAGIE